MKKNTVAVLLAGGRGDRIGGYKQFQKINNKRVLFYSLDVFIGCSAIGLVIVVVPAEKLQFAKRIIKQNYKGERIVVTVGESTRRWSTYSAVKYVEDKNIRCDYMLFHDAARPIITEKTVRELIKVSLTCDGCVLALKAPDLVLRLNKKGYIRECFKSDIYYGYTPQVFRFSMIAKAYTKFKNDKALDESDNIELLLRLGKPRIKILGALYQMPKLTYKSDLPILSERLK